jgi:hypothetical protein
MAVPVRDIVDDQSPNACGAVVHPSISGGGRVREPPGNDHQVAASRMIASDVPGVASRGVK